MSEQICCDTCGKVAQTESRLVEPGWRRVEYISDVHQRTSDLSERHFCSAYCAHDWFAKKVVEK